jgi:hypothetical protein
LSVPRRENAKACPTATGNLARVEQVHVPALAVAQAGLAAEDLGRHGVHVHALGQGEVVRPMGRGDRVPGAQVRAQAHGDRFLAGGQVHLAGDQACADIPGRGLVGVVVPLQRSLVGADPHHLRVEVASHLVVHDHPPWVGARRRSADGQPMSTVPPCVQHSRPG